MERLQEIPVGDFGLAVNTIVHEIANPLVGMVATIQVLERDLESPCEECRERVLEGLHDLRSEVTRLRRLLDELREIGRQSRLVLGPVSLQETVAAVLRPLKNASSRVRIREAVPQDLPHVLADAAKLKQGLLNLAKNALEAMPGGGELLVSAYCTGEKVCLEIADTGEGIPENANVFADFVSSKPDGSGIGLGITRRIVEAHGGSIEFTSKPARGTVFKVVLQAAA